MYVTYTRIYGWSDYGGESSYQPGYRLENMMWMTLLVYDYIIPGDKFISYNPMPETKPYPRVKPKVRVLGKEKLKVFLEAASKNPWYLEILLGLFCGLRKGEILGLKFQDFDFEKQTVRISRQLVGNLKLKE